MIQITEKCKVKTNGAWALRSVPTTWRALANEATKTETVELKKFRVAIKVRSETASYWVDIIEAESFEKVFEVPEVIAQITESGLDINMLDISVMEWLEWNEFIKDCN